MVEVHRREGSAAEAAHHSAAAAIREAPAPAFAAVGAAQGRTGVELGAADRPVMIGVEPLEQLPAALAPALLPLPAAGFGAGPDLVLGDEAVAIGVGSGETGLDPGRDRGAGLRLSETRLAFARLGEDGKCGEGGKRRAGENKLAHFSKLPWETGKND